MGEPASVLRPLGPSERILWWLDRGATLNFTTIARVRGAISIDGLRAAIDAAQARHPLLGVAIRDGDFVRVPDQVPLRTAEKDWSTEVERELRTLFDLEAGPFARAVWVPEAGGGHLLLTLHHCVGDGKSGVFLVRDILAALSGETLAALPAPAPISARYPRRVFGPGMWWRAIRSFSRELWSYRRGPTRFLPRETGSIAGRTAAVRGFTFSAAETERLVERCRAERTTVNGAMTAALMQAVAAQLGGRRHLCAGTPVDLRARLDPPVGEDVGYFVGMVMSRHAVDPEAPLWPLAREVKDRMHTDAARGLAVWFHRFMNGFFKLLLRGDPTPAELAQKVYDRPLAASGITNLGRLTVPERYGELHLEALHFAVAPSVLGDLATTATTFRGQLQWNFCGQVPTVDPATLQAIGEDAVGRVKSAPS